MTSPVSVGDVILLSQLIYRLVRTLTVDRKDAPNSFKEVQNQVFALDNALNSLGIHNGLDRPLENTHSTLDENLNRVLQNENDQESSTVFGQMVKNCFTTLSRLEKLISKYKTLDQSVQSSSTDQGAKASWRNNIKEQWHRIKFLAENDEFNSIRNDISIHIEALTLAITNLNNSRSRRMHHKLDDVHAMLDDLHKLFLSSPSLDSSATGSPESSQRKNPLTFRLFTVSPVDQSRALLCPKASFKSQWRQSMTNSIDDGIFTCYCVTRSQTGSDLEGIHTEDLEYHLTEWSLIIRLAGPKRAWQMFSASNMITSLIIEDVAPSKFATFQNEINQLAVQLAEASLKSGASTSLFYHSLLGTGEAVVSVLDTKFDSSSLRGKIKRVTFVAQRNSFTHRSVDSVQLLHYRTLPHQRHEMTHPEETVQLVHQSHIDMVLHTLSGSTETDIKQVDMKGVKPFPIANPTYSPLPTLVDYETVVTQGEDAQILVFQCVDCSVQKRGRNPQEIRDLKVEIEFVTDVDALQFLHGIRSMQDLLKLYYLQFPQLEDKRIFMRSCGNLLIKEFFFTDATLTVLYRPMTSTYRLIVQNSTLASCLSVELSPDSFTLLLKSGRQQVDIDLPAYFIEHGIHVTNVSKDTMNLPTILPRGREISAPQET